MNSVELYFKIKSKKILYFNNKCEMITPELYEEEETFFGLEQKVALITKPNNTDSHLYFVRVYKRKKGIIQDISHTVDYSYRFTPDELPTKIEDCFKYIVDNYTSKMLSSSIENYDTNLYSLFNRLVMNDYLLIFDNKFNVDFLNITKLGEDREFDIVGLTDLSIEIIRKDLVITGKPLRNFVDIYLPTLKCVIKKCKIVSGKIVEKDGVKSTMKFLDWYKLVGESLEDEETFLYHNEEYKKVVDKFKSNLKKHKSTSKDFGIIKINEIKF